MPQSAGAEDGAFFRGGFLLLVIATLGLALSVLQDEKERGRRGYADALKKTESQIAARLRALANHSADQRIKRSYLLERARLTAPGRKRSAAQRDASASSL